jgi:DNA-binding beta-propeller fold protein YncE
VKTFFNFKSLNYVNLTKILNYSSLKVIHSSSVKGCITGCSMTSKGQVVVSDTANNQIVLMDVNGKELQNLEPQLPIGIPSFMAIDSTDQLFVCDQSGIHKFDANNNWLRRYPSQGAFGIAVNNSNQLIISSYYQHCVTVLDQNGALQFTIGTPNQRSDNDGHFDYPRGVSISSNQSILVKDSHLLVILRRYHCCRQK